MPVVTFTSPSMARDVRAYATAGDTKTVLAVALAHGVKIPHDCQDGECGSCLIQVEYLEGKPKMAIALSEKEKLKLRELGRITIEQIKQAEINDIAPPYRLACQFIVREEEVAISFVGDPV